MAKLGKILVVEDDPYARQGLSDLLSAWGYETETAVDGAEALDEDCRLSIPPWSFPIFACRR